VSILWGSWSLAAYRRRPTKLPPHRLT